MWDGELPPPNEQRRIQIRREALSDKLLAPFAGLADLDAEDVENAITLQRTFFATENSKPSLANDEEGDMDVPLDDYEPVAKKDEEDATARFAPSDSWRRPSDYVAHMARRFEDEWTNPRSGRNRAAALEA